MIGDYIQLEEFIKIEDQYENVNFFDGFCVHCHVVYFGNKYCNICGNEIIERIIVKIGEDVYIFSNNINVLHDLDDDLDDSLDEYGKVFINIDSEFNKKRSILLRKNHKNDIKLLEVQIGKIKVQFSFLKYRC